MQRILVVEDDAANLKLLRVILQKQGYLVLEAIDGDQALERAQQELPDLILMDVQLPRTDGLTATHLLKNDARTREIPVIAVTAFAMSGDAERMLQGGFDAYISKPINYRELLHKVGRLLPSEDPPAP